MRYLAIDHGQKRTGLAISDASEKLASPYQVIETSSETELLRRVVDIITTEQIEGIVIGLPYNMDGSEGPRAEIVRRFSQALTKRVNIPVIFHDERLSSYEAEHLLADLELTRKKKKKRLDAVAAAAILQCFLDHKKLNRNPADDR